MVLCKPNKKGFVFFEQANFALTCCMVGETLLLYVNGTFAEKCECNFGCYYVANLVSANTFTMSVGLSISTIPDKRLDGFFQTWHVGSLYHGEEPY